MDFPDVENDEFLKQVNQAPIILHEPTIQQRKIEAESWSIKSESEKYLEKLEQKLARVKQRPKIPVAKDPILLEDEPIHLIKPFIEEQTTVDEDQLPEESIPKAISKRKFYKLELLEEEDIRNKSTVHEEDDGSELHASTNNFVSKFFCCWK